MRQRLSSGAPMWKGWSRHPRLCLLFHKALQVGVRVLLYHQGPSPQTLSSQQHPSGRKLPKRLLGETLVSHRCCRLKLPQRWARANHSMFQPLPGCSGFLGMFGGTGANCQHRGTGAQSGPRGLLHVGDRRPSGSSEETAAKNPSNIPPVVSSQAVLEEQSPDWKAQQSG